MADMQNVTYMTYIGSNRFRADVAGCFFSDFEGLLGVPAPAKQKHKKGRLTRPNNQDNRKHISKKTTHPALSCFARLYWSRTTTAWRRLLFFRGTHTELGFCEDLCMELLQFERLQRLHPCLRLQRLHPEQRIGSDSSPQPPPERGDRLRLATGCVYDPYQWGSDIAKRYHTCNTQHIAACHLCWTVRDGSACDSFMEAPKLLLREPHKMGTSLRIAQDVVSGSTAGCGCMRSWWCGRFFFRKRLKDFHNYRL